MVVFGQLRLYRTHPIVCQREEKPSLPREVNLVVEPSFGLLQARVSILRPILRHQMQKHENDAIRTQGDVGEGEGLDFNGDESGIPC